MYFRALRRGETGQSKINLSFSAFMSELHAVVATGKATYKIQVPYKLIRTGAGEKVPLVIWLHGFGQTMSWMKKTCEPVWGDISAHHLFVQAPYLLLESYVQKKPEGYSWYMFNGEREHYEDSMEHAAEFILDLAGKLRAVTHHKEIHVAGYSQGGYLAGYMALSRPHLVTKAIMLAGRFKHEWVKDWEKVKDIHLVGIHGDADTEVLPGPQREALEVAQNHGVKTEFRLVEGGHKLSDAMLQELAEVLK
jgi:predicted esterase